jgi:lysozyme
MRLSDTGLSLIKRFEGFRSHVYLDVAGLPTIGYGHRLLASESFPSGITVERAIEILTNDVLAAESAILRHVKAPLTQGQFDALVDFVFNLGAERLANSTLLAKLNLQQYEAAAEQLLRWDHAGMIEIEGLKARRQAEFALWSSNPAPSKQPEPIASGNATS